MQVFLHILLAIWQLPQTLLGLLTLLFIRSRYKHYHGSGVWAADSWTSGVCLGEIIVLRSCYMHCDLMHEFGHRQQSRILGPLYLFIVGIPSAVGNLIDRWFHQEWTGRKREYWYYNLPWEADADERGGVIRRF